MSQLLKEAKDDLDILNSVSIEDHEKPLRGITLSARRRMNYLQLGIEDSIQANKTLREIERIDSAKLELQAKQFSSRMVKANEEADKRREENKRRLLFEARESYKRENLKRHKEAEMKNEEKRVIIASNLENLRLNAERRALEIKHKAEHFEFVKRNLSPPMDHDKQLQVQKEMLQYSDGQLKRRKSLMKPVNMEELYQHRTRVEIALRQREIAELVNKSPANPKAYNPLDFVKHKSNPYFVKKQEFFQLHDKSLMYADTIQDKLEQRSPPKAIRNWQEGQRRNNFGYFYREEVHKRKEEKNNSFDPLTYLSESIAIGKKSIERKGGINSQSLAQVELEVGPKASVPYKQFLAEHIDQTKVRDEQMQNKQLNYYERLERAKKFKDQAHFNKNNSNPAAENVDQLAEECIKSRSPNVFKKYLSTLDYLEQQAALKEKQEKMGQKDLPLQVRQTKGDSIDLLSLSIKSKLKLLTGASQM